MYSLRELYRIGPGPSSSHTMGPRFCAKDFLNRLSDEMLKRVSYWRVVLYGSLAATGKGHMSDKAVIDALRGDVRVCWEPKKELSDHPNGLTFEAFDVQDTLIDKGVYYSIGGGAFYREGEASQAIHIYKEKNFSQIISYCRASGVSFCEYVYKNEGSSIEAYFRSVWDAMKYAVEEGLKKQGILPGGLRLERRARSCYLKARRLDRVFRRTGMVSSYALSVAEENASLGTVVTAPTCGACGVLPAVLYYLKEYWHLHDDEIIKGLCVAGLVGNCVKTNATISGAEAGCQAEIGTACAMAAASAAELMGATFEQVEYAAEMGMEHHLGLTCDPVMGLVQIPCIERNASAATRALDCAELALLSDGRHRISFDQVVETMARTGRDLGADYRETSRGGLAALPM